MIVIAWIVLVVNILVGLIMFSKTFTDKTATDRVANFVSVVASVLTFLS